MFKEIWSTISTLFKSYDLNEDVLKIPKSIKKMGYKIEIVGFSNTLISLVFAFLLKVSNGLITQRLLIAGIFFFMLYMSYNLINEGLHVYLSNEDKKFDLIFKNELWLRSFNIISKVSNKIVKYDTTDKLYKLLPNEVILNSIKNFTQNYWRMKISQFFGILTFISVIVMLIVAVITNTSIPQPVFISLIVSFSLISFLASAFLNIKRKEYFSIRKEQSNKESLIINDMLRVPSIVSKDISMRLNKFKDSLKISNSNESGFTRNMNKLFFIISIIETLAQYGLIIFFISSIGFNSINSGTLTEIIATLTIAQTALTNIQRLTRNLNSYNDKFMAMKNEEKDIKLILKYYNSEEANKVNIQPISVLNIPPFEISYIEESENDKPFTLSLETLIQLKKGDVAILYGPSGSGKSTFLKLITERILINKNIDIPSTTRFYYYEKSLYFGSLSIYDELFCCTDNPDIGKMEDILKNLFLFEEISNNCIDIWKWLKEKKYKHLSDGQQQRLILAKMMYWLDDTIDVVVLDEATSGLDDNSETHSADAQRILNYVIRYCNKDKKRIIAISTHQNLDGVINQLSNQFNFLNFLFTRDSKKNVIKQI